MKDLRSFIDELKDAGELVTIDKELSVEYEAACAIKIFSESDNRAVFLSKAKDYNIPIVGNLLGTRKRLAMAMGVEEADLAEAYTARRNNPISPEIVETGPVQDNVLVDEVNIRRVIPVLRHHEKDVGPYITTGLVTAKDPDTGIRGMGIHRILVKGENRLGIFLDTPPLRDFFSCAENRNMELEIAIAIGAEPITFFSGALSAGPGTDKMDIAGGLAEQPVPLVRCKTVALEVPANAEFVLEGRVLPKHREPEGPFGESTGYYLAYNNPVVEVTAITHRNDPIYHALVPFCGEEEVILDFLWQLEKKNQFLSSMAGLRDLHLYFFGLVTVAQVAKEKDEDARTILKALMDKFVWGKTFIAVDQDVDPHDIKDVIWAVSTRFQPDRDLIISSNVPGLSIDPSTVQKQVSSDKGKMSIAETSKMGVDATVPLDEKEKFEKIKVPDEVLTRVQRLLGVMSK